MRRTMALIVFVCLGGAPLWSQLNQLEQLFTTGTARVAFISSEEIQSGSRKPNRPSSAFVR
ncbi:MAG: hypothetical protein RMJ46_00745 [Bacteroidota bacterium]|nr:hypothetical protein [Bacteroidota bacterium]